MPVASLTIMVLRLIAIKLFSAFSPLRIRVGGSLQDQVVYKVGRVKNCPRFKKKEDGLFGFSSGCLPMERWDELINFFNQTGYIYIFSLIKDFILWHFLIFKTLTKFEINIDFSEQRLHSD